MSSCVRAALAAQVMFWLLLGSACSVPPGSARAEERATPAPSAVPGCPSVAPTVVTGKVKNDQLDEISGATASRRNAGVYWVHNDSGDYARVFAIDASGRTLAELKLDDAVARDVEDIALVHGKDGKPDVLYLADTGDNARHRRTVQLFRIEEPTLDLKRSDVELVRPSTTIEVKYDDGPHDAEALLADPQSGDLFLVAKSHKLWAEDPVGVYRLPAAELARGKVVARKVVDVALGPVTAGDVASDGSAVLLRNYWSAMYWLRAPGESIATVLARPGCRLPVSDVSKQGESITFMSDGKGYVTVPEGSHPGLYRYAFTQ